MIQGVTISNNQIGLFFYSQVRVVLLAAAPVDRLFVHTGGEDERDRQLLDELGLSGVNNTSATAEYDVKLQL